jgi:hypothetical protein
MIHLENIILQISAKATPILSFLNYRIYMLDEKGHSRVNVSPSSYQELFLLNDKPSLRFIR